MLVFAPVTSVNIPLHKRIEELKIIHRAKDAPGVLALAESIRAGDVLKRSRFFNQAHTDIQWIEPTNARAIEELVAEIGSHAKRLQGAAEQTDLDTVLGIQQELQVLCAHRGALQA